MNFLALLGWSYDGRARVVHARPSSRRCSSSRAPTRRGVQPREARMDERRLPARDAARGEYAERLLRLPSRGRLGPGRAARHRAPRGAPLPVQEKLATFAEFERLLPLPLRPGRDGSRRLGARVEGNERAGEVLSAARRRPGGAAGLDDGMRFDGCAARARRGAWRPAQGGLHADPRRAHQPHRRTRPVRSAEALGREETLARLDAAAARLAVDRRAARRRRRARGRRPRTRGLRARPARRAPRRPTSASAGVPCASSRQGRERSERELGRAAGGGVVRRHARARCSERVEAAAAPGRVGQADRDRARQRAPQLGRGGTQARHAPNCRRARAPFRGGCGFCYLAAEE